MQLSNRIKVPSSCGREVAGGGPAVQRFGVNLRACRKRGLSMILRRRGGRTGRFNGLLGGVDSLGEMSLLTNVRAWRRYLCRRDRTQWPSACPSHSPAPGRTSARVRKKRGSVRFERGTPLTRAEFMPDQWLSHDDRTSGSGATPCSTAFSKFLLPVLHSKARHFREVS